MKEARWRSKTVISEILHCDAIKTYPSNYFEMYWKVKGGDEIGYCNSARQCWRMRSQLLEDERIQVVSISSGTLSIKQTFLEESKETRIAVTFTCDVHNSDNKKDISDATSVYSFKCK